MPDEIIMQKFQCSNPNCKHGLETNEIHRHEDFSIVILEQCENCKGTGINTLKIIIKEVD